METVSVPLTPTMRAFVEEQIAAGGDQGIAAYLQRLLREEQRRKARERLEAKLLEALDSDPVEVTPAFWEARRQELKKRLESQGNLGQK